MDKIIKRHARYDMTHLSDALSCIAANIEDSLILSGAEAGKDYNYTDLMQLAMKYLLSTEHGKTFYTETT